MRPGQGPARAARFVSCGTQNPPVLQAFGDALSHGLHWIQPVRIRFVQTGNNNQEVCEGPAMEKSRLLTVGHTGDFLSGSGMFRHPRRVLP